MVFLMKTIAYLVLSFSLISSSALADTVLKNSDITAVSNAITLKAEANGLSNVELDSKQTFDVVRGGSKLGTLVQGRGWKRDIHPVCFVAWSTNNKDVDLFKTTIGVDDWETADCDKIDAVGLISKPEESETKIAVVYSVDTRGQASHHYVIFGLRNKNELFYDSRITVSFENSYVNTLSELRKKYQIE